MTETIEIRMVTTINDKQTETEMTREEFEKILFDLLTDPKFKHYRCCAGAEDGNTYTHLRFNDIDSKELQRYKHKINFYIKRERD